MEHNPRLSTLTSEIALHGLRNALSFIPDSMTAFLALIVFGRTDEEHSSAVQLTNILLALNGALRNYATIFNKNIKSGDALHNKTVYTHSIKFNIAAAVASTALLYIGANIIYPLEQLNLNQKSVQLCQEFIWLGAIGAALHLFERSQQQFILSSSHKNPAIAHESFLKIAWKNIPPVTTNITLAAEAAYIFSISNPSNPFVMSSAYLITKVIMVSLYSRVFSLLKVFPDDQDHSESRKALHKKMRTEGLFQVGLLVIEIFFPILQSFLLAKRNRDLAIYGITNFITNILFNIGMSFQNGATIVISQHSNKSLANYKKATMITLMLQLTLAFLYTAPFFISPRAATTLFAKQNELIDDVVSLMAPMWIWSYSAAVAHGFTASLRATDHEKAITYARLGTQWGLNLVATLTLILQYDAGVRAVLWSNAITHLFYTTILGTLFATSLRKLANESTTANIVPVVIGVN